MNYAAMAFKMASADFKLGSDIMNITANYMTSKVKEAQLRVQAKNYEEEATYHEKQAGAVQEAGRQAREQRLLKAGQDKGAIMTGAAGSGIDVSSKVVRKTLKDTMQSAYNDAAVMAKNEQVASQTSINQRETAKENALWTEYSADMEKKNRTWQAVSGALSAGANWASGMADAGSALMSG